MDIHSCSYYCENPLCIKRQRDELRDKLFAQLEEERKQQEAVEVVGRIINPE
jgi:hypothetical protein